MPILLVKKKKPAGDSSISTEKDEEDMHSLINKIH